MRSSRTIIWVASACALTILLIGSVATFGQTVDTAWVRIYNGPGNNLDRAGAIAVDGSGNVYVTGGSHGSGTSTDYATIKYYPNGDTAWERRHNGTGNGEDYAYALAIDDSENVYVTGSIFEGGSIYGCLTIKYYPDGDTDWVRQYNGPMNNGAGGLDLAIDNSGNVYVTGLCLNGTAYWDYCTIKYYSNGDSAWVRTLNGSGDHTDMSRDIAVDGSGNAYVTGISYGSGTDYDYATIKYLPNGDVAPGWPKIYDNVAASKEDMPSDIVVDNSGNVYVTGQSYGTGTDADYLTIKYYPNGNIAWEKRYNNPWNTDDRSSSIALDGAGNIFVAGISGGHNFTIKYNANGDTVWTRRYQSETYPDTIDAEPAIVTDECDNLYLTGSIHTSDTSYDYFTIKYRPNGDTVWAKRYNGPGSSYDVASAIAVDDSGCYSNVYVTGASWGSGTYYDYATIKYIQISTDVKDETGKRKKPSEFALSQNYPNPFNSTTKIDFTLAKSGFVNMTIYNLLGRRVRTLVSEQVSSGYKSVLWDGKNEEGEEVTSGIYFYKIQAGYLTQVKKIVLLK